MPVCLCICACSSTYAWEKCLWYASTCVYVCVCVSVCVFSMGFPLLCPGLKAPFSLICCVSCPLCLLLFSSAHPITAQWLIACLASKASVYVSVYVCEREKQWWQREIVCMPVCVVCEHVSMGFLHIASDPEWSPDCILITGTLHGVTEKTTHTHTRTVESGRAKGTGMWSRIIRAKSPLVVNGREST